MSICKGVAGRRGGPPVGIFIHNDAGREYMNGRYWYEQLKNADQAKLERGFAHAYVGNDGVFVTEDDENCAYHCGNENGNINFLSVEACQSYGDLKTFLANEEKALQWAVQKCKQYGITPSASTIRLHQEVYATACPHRSVEVHGGAEATKAYFIKRIKELMGGADETVTIQSNSNTTMERKVTTMYCTYKITDLDKDKVYYFDGHNSYPLMHPDELNILRKIYKDNNGHDMPHYDWTSKAPWFKRLKEALDETTPAFFVR
ncbi:MAG: peptidoglycan recognition family protein [Muricomes sp.]